VWGGDEAAVMVEFDQQGAMARKTWIDGPESFRGWLLGHAPWLERLGW
jgi:hypothetical protein